MEDFHKRLIVERDELDEKIESLSKIINEGSIFNLEPTQVTLLMIQISAMRTYSVVLNQRLAWLQNKKIELYKKIEHLKQFL